MSKINDKYNTYFEQVKGMAEYLYHSTLSNEDKQEKRSVASYREMISVKEKLEDTEDNFQDFSKIESTIDVIRHGREFCLEFKAIDRPFLNEYNNKKVFPLVMSNGHPITGSRFNEIFVDNTKYWGYISDEITNASFELRLNEKKSANKIYLSTTHSCIVKAYAKSNFEDDYVYLGERSGLDHIWNFWPKNIVMIKFETESNIFSVRYVMATLCEYKSVGKIITNSFDIEDLYKLGFDIDSDEPSGTSLEIYGILNGNRFKLDKSIINTITGAVNWYEAPPCPSGAPIGSGNIPYPSGYHINDPLLAPWPSGITLPSGSVILPSGCLQVPSGILPSGGVISGLGAIIPYDLIEDSITAHPGYRKWNKVDEFDYVWEVFKFDVETSTGFVDIDLPITTEYIIPQESIKSVYTGTTDSKEVFEKGEDYGATVTADTITLDLTSTDILNATTLTAEILLRIKTPILQVRTYVDSLIEMDIDLDFSGISAYTQGTSKCVVRTVNITNKINEESLFETTRAAATVTLKNGTNLIELVFYSDKDDDDTLFLPTDSEIVDMTDDNFKELDYFAYDYTLERIQTDNADNRSYYLDELRSQYEIYTAAQDILLSYATIEPDMDFKIEIIFRGTGGWITPSLRFYGLLNSIK